jgi:hypothetical protein
MADIARIVAGLRADWSRRPPDADADAGWRAPPARW